MPTITATRPAAMFAIATWLATIISQALAIPGSLLTGLILAPSVMTVGLLTRGPTVLIPGLIGQCLGLWQAGIPPDQWWAPTIALVIGPALAAAALRGMRKSAAEHSHLVQTLQLYLSIGVLLAPALPLSNLAFSSMPWPASPVGQGWQLAAQWMAGAMTGVIFVRGILAWMPENGGGFCPVAGLRGGVSVFDRQLMAALFTLGGLTAVSLLLQWAGYPLAARPVILSIFGVAIWASLFAARRVAGSVLMAAMASILYLFYRAPTGSAVSTPEEVLLLTLQLTMGAAMLHLLNALIEERSAQQRTLRRQAFTNEASGLPNMRALDEQLSELRADRSTVRQAVTFAEVMVTGLHGWTNRVGYGSVTAVEREVGERVTGAFAASAIKVAHIGTGRYIAILRAPVSDARIDSALAEVFVDRRYRLAGNLVQLRHAVAIVDCPEGPPVLESALTSLAIAQEKAGLSNERSCRLTLDGAQIAAYRAELAWIEKVKDLLSQDRLRLYAQPIAPAVVNAQSPLHFEILSRLQDEDGQTLTPDRFLPALVRAGLHTEFDRHVLSRTLSYLSAHRELYDATRLVAINVTGPTICDPGFAAYLCGALDQFGIDGDRLAIEITESESIADLEHALSNIRALAARGVRIAVDDFGTGQATFEYIRQLRPDILKIDGSFVRSYASNPLDREIVQSIVRLAAATGASSVAEFVETDAVADQMREIGVQFLQGWAIAKPMPIEEIKAFCERRRRELACSSAAASQRGSLAEPATDARRAPALVEPIDASAQSTLA